MSTVIIYESLTGNTRKAASLIAARLRANGVPTDVYPIGDIDLQRLSDASVVIIGTWTQGHFVVAQKPAGAAHLKTMPAIAGKRCYLYLTYALAAGKALDALAATVETRGGEVYGVMKILRNKLDAQCAEFADGILRDLAVR